MTVCLLAFMVVWHFQSPLYVLILHTALFYQVYIQLCHFQTLLYHKDKIIQDLEVADKSKMQIVNGT